MMRKWGLMKFIVALFLGMLLVTTILPVYSFAIDDQYTNTKQFDSHNSVAYMKIGNTNGTIAKFIFKAFAIILNLVRIIAFGWAIIMLIAVAIKYMSGSPQIKAQLKTDIPTYLIGAAILFGATGILTIIEWFVEDVIV